MLEPVSAIGIQLGFAAIYSLSRPGSAVSAEAKAVRETAEQCIESLERSDALFGTKAAAIQSVWGLQIEHGEAGWDGYDALPVDRYAVFRAVAVIRALPEDIAMPEIAVDPDGSVSLDWIASRHRMLTLSVGAENDRLAYAWIDGTDRGHAVSKFDNGTVPERLLQAITSVVGRADAPVGAA